MLVVSPLLIGGLDCNAQSSEVRGSPQLELIQIGQAEGLNGQIVYTGQTVVVVSPSEGGDDLPRGISPFESDPVPVPESGVAISLEHCNTNERWLESDLSVRTGEAVAQSVQFAIGSYGQATVAVIADSAPGKMGMFNYLPLYLRVYSDGRVISERFLGDDVFSCPLVIDDFADQPGNEIAQTWVSLGGSGYTIGVTLFALKE